MTNLLSNILFCSFLAVASVVSAATAPIDVTVSDASGKLAYKGSTTADGTFSTGKLQPGNYVVQFKSNNVKGDYTIVVSAGKNKVTADLVAGSRLGGGGVAMKVAVGTDVNIAGQVALAPNARAAGSKTARTDASVESLRGMQDRSMQGAVKVSPTNGGH